MLAVSSSAQEATSRSSSPPAVKQVASELYFFFDYAGSNSVFLVTDDGVLVIDTREHPDLGQDLIDRIRQVTNKPIRWVVNSHFHGDHTFGNAVFKASGVTFVAQKETVRLMQLIGSCSL